MEFQNDVFISYSHVDRKWVWERLVPFLRRCGIRVDIDEESSGLGGVAVKNMEQAALRSRKTLLVMSPSYFESLWAEFENLVLCHLDPTAQKRRLIPLLLTKCAPPPRLDMLSRLDLTNPEVRRTAPRRLVIELHNEANELSQAREGKLMGETTHGFCPTIQCSVSFASQQAPSGWVRTRNGIPTRLQMRCQNTHFTCRSISSADIP